MWLDNSLENFEQYFEFVGEVHTKKEFFSYFKMCLLKYPLEITSFLDNIFQISERGEFAVFQLISLCYPAPQSFRGSKRLLEFSSSPTFLSSISDLLHFCFCQRFDKLSRPVVFVYFHRVDAQRETRYDCGIFVALPR